MATINELSGVMCIFWFALGVAEEGDATTKLNQVSGEWE